MVDGSGDDGVHYVRRLLKRLGISKCSHDASRLDTSLRLQKSACDISILTIARASLKLEGLTLVQCKLKNLDSHRCLRISEDQCSVAMLFDVNV